MEVSEMKKIISLILVLVMMLSFSVLAFADGSPAPAVEPSQVNTDTVNEVPAKEVVKATDVDVTEVNEVEADEVVDTADSTVETSDGSAVDVANAVVIVDAADTTGADKAAVQETDAAILNAGEEVVTSFIVKVDKTVENADKIQTVTIYIDAAKVPEGGKIYVDGVAHNPEDFEFDAVKNCWVLKVAPGTVIGVSKPISK